MKGPMVHITADGTPWGVEARDAEGALIRGVRAIRWEAVAGSLPTATLEISMAAFDLDVDPVIVVGAYRLTPEQWRAVQVFMAGLTPT
jgi:hypothetical protein